MTSLTAAEEQRAFERLKPRLAALWDKVFEAPDEPYTTVVVPSVTVPEAELARQPGALFFEEILLFLLIRLRNPRARIVYVTSTPIPPALLDYHLHFLAGIPASHAVQRLTMLSAHDASPRPLTEKILERPRLMERIRAAIPDRSRAFLTVLRSTVLERRLAVQLDVPLNAADPGLDERLTKSAVRRLLQSTGIEVPAGAADLHDEAQIVEALREVQARHPGLRRAVLKLNRAQWDANHAVVELPASGDAAALGAALRAMTFSAASEEPAAWLERFARLGGVVEEVIESEAAPCSVQVRINAVGRVGVTSTHDEVKGGTTGHACRGCVFPADDAHRLPLMRAGLDVGRRLAQDGVTGRLSVELLAGRADDGTCRLVGHDVNLGYGGSTHPLLAVRFLTAGALDPMTGLFLSPAGHAMYYRATDHLQSEAYRGLVPEDIIEILTMNRLNYSPHTESGALFYLLGGCSSTGRVGMVAIGNSRERADEIFTRTAGVLDAEARVGG
jgi:hypothetical protein